MVKMEMIQRLMAKREMKQQILKVQPVKKLMIFKKEKKVHCWEKDTWTLWRWKINDKIGGDDVASVEEAEIMSSELFQPKTSNFSTRALIWVHFKSVHYFSQPIFSLLSHLKNVLHNLVIELCSALKTFQKYHTNFC